MAQTLFPNAPLAHGEQAAGFIHVKLYALPGWRITLLRKELRLSRAEAARAIGVHPGTLHRAEKGDDILMSNACAIINWLWMHGAYAFEVRPANEVTTGE